MKKADAELAIRSLTRTWYGGIAVDRRGHLSFSDFKTWLRGNGYGQYLQFRSRMGPDEDAERWFNNELGQGWRN